VGTDFWVAFPPNSGTANIELHISSNVSTSGSVYSAYPGVNQNFTVVPGVVTQLTLPSNVVLAAEDGTTVTVNGVIVATINTGDYYEAILTGYNSISTNHASFLAQFAKGQFCSGLTGDPFMVIIPPEEQFLTNYTVVNVAGFGSQWVNIIAPSNAISIIYQDGVLIPSGAFTQIGTTNFYGAQRSVTDGSHTFSSSFPFGVFVYGWNAANSYGYPGGCSLSPVGTVNSITLSPLTASGQLNVTSVCLTANVLDINSNPVAGVLVNFHVSGINPLNGNAYTDASGNAVYCYTQTGVTPGTDNVYARNPVTFTAAPTNGGITPAYQWKVNGGNAVTGISTYTYNPLNGDQVSCVLTSNLACTQNNPASSGNIIMSSLTVPSVSFTLCFDSITIVSASPFILKGGIPLGGTYSGSGVDPSTGMNQVNFSVSDYYSNRSNAFAVRCLKD
jgi:hypothetical protein